MYMQFTYFGLMLYLQEELEVLRSIYDGDTMFKETGPTTFHYKVMYAQLTNKLLFAPALCTQLFSYRA